MEEKYRNTWRRKSEEVKEGYVASAESIKERAGIDFPDSSREKNSTG